MHKYNIYRIVGYTTKLYCIHHILEKSRNAIASHLTPNPKDFFFFFFKYFNQSKFYEKIIIHVSIVLKTGSDRLVEPVRPGTGGYAGSSHMSDRLCI